MSEIKEVSAWTVDWEGGSKALSWSRLSTERGRFRFGPFVALRKEVGVGVNVCLAGAYFRGIFVRVGPVLGFFGWSWVSEVREALEDARDALNETKED